MRPRPRIFELHLFTVLVTSISFSHNDNDHEFHVVDSFKASSIKSTVSQRENDDEKNPIGMSSDSSSYGHGSAYENT